MMLTNDSLELMESALKLNHTLTTNFEKEGKVPKTLAYCLLFVVSMVGNSLIIWAIHRDKRLKVTNNFLIANMAVSDILSTIVSLPLTVVDINFERRWFISGTIGRVFCKLVVAVPDVSTSVSFYSCLFIALERYYAVAHPLIFRGGFNKSRLKYIILGIWTFSALIVSPYFYLIDIEVYENTNYCIHKDRYYEIIHFYVLIALTFGIPIPVIATLYTLIVCKLRRQKLPGKQTCLFRKARESVNRKILQMSVMIVSLLSFSLLFFSVIMLLILGDVITSDSESWMFAAIFFGRSSFAYNFFIYLIFNDIYRESFKGVMKMCCSKTDLI